MIAWVTGVGGAVLGRRKTRGERVRISKRERESSRTIGWIVASLRRNAG